MHDVRKLGLQVFAAPDNMTGQAQIQVRAREIDFVTSFGKNMKALLDVMGITRMIKKTNGTVLKVKKVSGTLQSGEVAEGDEIPLSQYKVEETDFDTAVLATKLFAEIPNIDETNVEQYFSEHHSEYEIDTDRHRMMVIPQLFGLITKTPFFF